MREKIQSIIEDCISELFGVSESVEITRPEEQYGDYATNVALKLAGKIKKAPLDIAESIKSHILKNENEFISNLSIAGPGFINIEIHQNKLYEQAAQFGLDNYKNKVVVAEFSDANPFKDLHAGHFYTSIVGDVLANLLEYAGARVHRVNFGADVGKHVAINIWAMLRDLGAVDSTKLDKIDKKKRAQWLSKCYVTGYKAYQFDDQIREEIKKLNKEIYEIVIKQEKDSELAKIYWTTRQWSYDYFDEFYDRIDVKFEKYIPESEVSELGKNTVLANVPDVYEKSDGAIVFKGEKHNLYTNVFINSEGIPTYSAKDVGLIIRKWQDYRFDLSFIISASEIESYMKVVLKSLEYYQPELVKSTVHLTHGFVKLKGGVKMSSRLGNTLTANEVIELTKNLNKYKDEDEIITISAIKYAFLKNRIGPDIVFDPEESISLEGNSGPYLQYAHARAMSILSKAKKEPLLRFTKELDNHERALLRKLSEYKEVLNLCVNELRPHYLCTYLFELTQTFNRFYENSKVIGDDREGIRLGLVTTYAKHLKSGLSLLGIKAPNKM